MAPYYQNCLILVKKEIFTPEYLETNIYNHIKQYARNVSVVGGIKFLYTLKIDENYMPVILTYTEDEPHDLDLVIKPLGDNVRLDSPPWEFCLDSDEVNYVFTRTPSVFLLCEYNTDYSSHKLDVERIKSKEPELYRKFIEERGFKF